MELEALRQQSADVQRMTLEAIKEINEGHVQISADHKTVSENFKKAFERSDTLATKIAFLSLAVGLAALVLAMLRFWPF